MSETFLSRWSRRKQEVRIGEPSPEDIALGQARNAPAEPTPETAAPSGGTEELAASEAELSADEIAALPSLEDLTADTDISVFLRKGVPEPLRNAALRRMWSLDPKIRDFVCEAREYAYDWNTPGGVPGSGPLPTTEEVLRMAARIVGGNAHESTQPSGDGTEDAAAPGSQDREVPSSPTETSDVLAAVPPPALIRGEKPGSGAADHAATQPLSLSKGLADTAKAEATLEPDRTGGPVVSASRRRHGGAIPL